MIQILDTHNLYHTVRAKFGTEAKIDYAKLYKHRSVVVGYSAGDFENFLRMTGYEVNFYEGGGGNDIPFALMVAEILRLTSDHYILGSQNRLLIPVIEVLRGRGAYVEVLGAGIPPELRSVCNKWTDVQEDMLCTIA